MDLAQRNREYQKTWYKDHRDLQKERTMALKKRNFDFVWEIKESSQCSECGESDPRCLDFHHRDPASKDNAVSKLAANGCSLERIQREINKCDLLCANCHRKITCPRSPISSVL